MFNRKAFQLQFELELRQLDPETLKEECDKTIAWIRFNGDANQQVKYADGFKNEDECKITFSVLVF